MKRNVTLALDEETARWARIEAARRDISLSSFLAELLTERMKRTDGYKEAMRRSLSRKPRRLRRSGQSLPTREEIHDRSGLR